MEGVRESAADACRRDIATATSQVSQVTQLLQATGQIGVDWLTELCNGIVKERSIPEGWKFSLLIPIYKGKDAPLVVRFIQRD